MTAKEIRQQFLDFFAARGHKIVPSAPIVVKDDPTLLFTNAGMNQFKDYFLGIRVPEHTRIADTQKCLRVSGKHNDLEEVGIDTYHHTMFEMLGNWSFGDYFKKEAIEWSWELLTEVYQLDKERIYVTIFEGDEKDGLPKDEESKSFWAERIAPDRILEFNKKDNFWEMGDTGPCGPCTEIHVDLRSDEERKAIDGKTLVNKDHPQVIEIWNNVFMQFNRMKDGSLVELPARHVDTGMGLERLVRAIQGKQSNYDSDVFQDLIRELCLLTNNSYGKDDKTDIACRVIVDHIRAIAFTIADGQLPSNGGAGYVIRRILRRAVRYGFTYLGQEQPFIHKLLPFLANQMDTVFPELKAQLNFVSKVVFEEESSFLRTLGTGIKRFNALVDDGLVVNNEISGQQAFDLYDTYGFPFDLTRLMAQEAGLNINEADFEVELQKQKTRSRKAAEVDQGDWVNVLPDEEEEFIGYDSLESDIKIVKYRKIKQKDKEQYHLVFNHTPFYAEGGGQVGDTGVILSVNDRIQIVDTKKENNLIIHFADELPGKLESDFNALVDVEKRQDTQRNHSATHLLHRALREVLGKHVEQRGSLVNDQYLRFDFSHFQKISAEEMTRIESMVNAEIRANLPLNERRQMPIDQAKALGAMALFGEKYGDSVRVIQFGESVELCGGTHVKHTGEIGLLKVISESSVAAGIRRIEAVTGANAITYFEEKMQLLEDLSQTIGQAKDIVQAVKNLKEENEALKADLEKVAAEKAMEIKGWLKNQSNNLSDITFIGETIELGNAEHIKNLAFQLRNEVPNLVMAIGAVVNDKALLTVIIDDALVSSKGWNAGKMIKEVSPLIKGGGGGQPFYATAGGANPEGMTAAIAKIKEMISA